MIDFEIIKTGSKGNAVVLNGRVLIDCGVSLRSLSEHYRGLDIVLLTHIHGDHFNRTTIRNLALERPTLRFGTPSWLVGDLVACGMSKQNIDVYEMDTYYDYGHFSVAPFSLVHNVPNCGYKLHFHAPFPLGSALYATDTNSMSGIEAKGYDLYLLEANYGEKEILERIRKKEEAGEHCYEWDVLKNHLSIEKANDWLYENMGAHSKYVHIHQHEG